MSATNESDERETAPNTATKSQTNDDAKDTESENKKELSTRDAYFVSLNEWVKHANMSQNAQALFPWYLMTNYPQLFQNPLSLNGSAIFPITNLPNFSANNVSPQHQQQQQPEQNVQAAVGRQNFNLLRLLDEQAQIELINRTGGYEYVIAPFWKRAVAESIDVVLLTVLKIMIIFTVMNIFDLDLGFDLDKETLRKAMDDDDYASFVAVSMDFLALSSDLLMLEILTKILVCINEALWTTVYNGSTPGKAWMNIRIMYVEAIFPLQQVNQQMQQIPQIRMQIREPFRALLYPAETPSFMRALMRAVFKNLIMTLLFPVCFIMIFFKNNRTAYDVMTKTVVVECNPNPTLRRPTALNN